MDFMAISNISPTRYNFAIGLSAEIRPNQKINHPWKSFLNPWKWAHTKINEYTVNTLRLVYDKAERISLAFGRLDEICGVHQ